nr:non-specific lipid-transfer protein 2P-like [Lolium perenne]
MARAVAMCAVVAVVVAVMMVAPSAAAASAMAGAHPKCDVGKLIDCRPAIIGGKPPSDSCCSNLKAQKGCFCQWYVKDPDYSQYINSPNAGKTLDSCGIKVPACLL